MPVDPHAAHSDVNDIPFQPVLDPGRLEVLRELGLTESPDPDMERFAQRVRDRLSVPTALVSLVQEHQQVFPGMQGLPEPWAHRRATPLSHSLCQHVVESSEPLILSDARMDPLVGTNPAVTEIGVVAYAGVPLTDDHDRVLGSLCAIDFEPRDWTEVEMADLMELARDCGNDLRLRLSRLDAQRERERRDLVEHELQDQIARSSSMLAIAESINGTRTVVGIRARVARMADSSRDLEAAHLHLIADIGSSPATLSPAVVEAVRRREIVRYVDLDAPADALEAQSDAAAQAVRLHHAPDGVKAVICAPIIGAGSLLGVLEMQWNRPPPLDDQDRAMSSALASYLAQALERAQLIERRTGVAHQLQAAMLTKIPDVPELPMAACYVPADADEWVGGDWYDAIVLPDCGGRDLAVAVTVGDIIGHDIPAAAVMGQARAMLRQAAFDFPERGPADVITHFENACTALDIRARGTAVLAIVERSLTGDWTMTWTSAGHPPPILALPDGTATRLELSLEDQGMLFGYRDIYDVPRVDSQVDLAPGSTVFFYSDGVIEMPGVDVDDLVDELSDLVGAEHHRGPQAVVDAVSMQFGNGSDDLVGLAVQIPPTAG